MRLPEPIPFIPKDINLLEIINSLGTQNKLKELLDKNDTKYYYFDKWKYLSKEWKMDPVHVWAAVKFFRLSNQTLTISNSTGFTFKVGSTSLIQQYLHEFDLNLGGSLQGDTIIPSKDRDRYLISSLMEEAIASSQLEGAVTTRKVAKEMLESNRKPKNASEQMIQNNYLAMKWIVANQNAQFTIENIQHLHSILTHSTLSNNEDEGAFRKVNDINVVDVQTGKAVYTPPPARKLDKLIKDFCFFANDLENRNFFLHPISKAIILHFLIGYIHPFVDGNGRTARTVFYWYLLKHGYWLIEFMSVSRIILNSKAQYARAYLHTERDENDLTYFLIYNLRSIHKSLEDLRSYIKKKSAEKQNAITLLRNTNFNDRQILLIQEVIQDRTIFFTAQQVQTKFAVSNQTARTDLVDLVEQGILTERRSGHRIQYLPATDFMKKIEK